MIQAVCRKGEPRPAAVVEEKGAGNASTLDLPPATNPNLDRQATAPEVRYGDALIVRVVRATRLVACDYWSRSSDPYCLLSVRVGFLFKFDFVLSRLVCVFLFAFFTFFISLLISGTPTPFPLLSTLRTF